MSLSSWRAWIEIVRSMASAIRLGSLSSWRAWIEIGQPRYVAIGTEVALLMESVD